MLSCVVVLLWPLVVVLVCVSWCCRTHVARCGETVVHASCTGRLSGSAWGQVCACRLAFDVLVDAFCLLLLCRVHVCESHVQCAGWGPVYPFLPRAGSHQSAGVCPDCSVGIISFVSICLSACVSGGFVLLLSMAREHPCARSRGRSKGRRQGQK